MGGRGESIKKKGGGEDRDGDSCSTVEVIKTDKANGGWMMGAYVSIEQQQPSGRCQCRSGFKSVWMFRQTVMNLNLNPVLFCFGHNISITTWSFLHYTTCYNTVTGKKGT